MNYLGRGGQTRDMANCNARDATEGIADGGQATPVVFDVQGVIHKAGTNDNGFLPDGVRYRSQLNARRPTPRPTCSIEQNLCRAV